MSLLLLTLSSGSLHHVIILSTEKLRQVHYNKTRVEIQVNKKSNPFKI